MTSYADLLGVELECAICTDQYSSPTLAGDCGHTFCKEPCLRMHIQTSAAVNPAVNYLGAFPCPICRKSCRVPPNGVDGLALNYTVAGLIERLKDARKTVSVQAKCSFCDDSDTKKVKASAACLQCENICLCEGCSDKHFKHPETKTHTIISLCELHGRPLKKYCLSCNRPICVECFGKHSIVDEHEVADYRGVVAASKQALTRELEAAPPAKTRLEQADKKLANMMTEIERRKEKSTEAVTCKFIADISLRDDSITTLDTEIEYHQAQLDRKKKDKQVEEEMKKHLIEEEAKLVQSIEDECQEIYLDVKNVKTDVGFLLTDLDYAVSYSKTLADGRLLHGGLQHEIVESREKLERLHTETEIDRVAPLTDMVKTISAREEYVASAGKFSSACFSYELELPTGFDVFSTAFMSRGRIAVSGKGGDHKVLLWKLPKLTPDVILTEKSAMPYIAVQGEDKLVVLRRKKPILKVINVTTDQTQELDVNITDQAVKDLWSVEVCRDNFVIIHGKGEDKHALVVDPRGTIKRDVACGRPSRPTFSKPTGLLTMCNNTTETISCYKMMGTNMNTMMSVRHGVAAIDFYDICSGSLGEIFVVGLKRNEKKEDKNVEKETKNTERKKENTNLEIGIYQMYLDTKTKAVSMKEIKPRKKMTTTEDDAPKCTVWGNSLVVGYGNTVHALKLSA